MKQRPRLLALLWNLAGAAVLASLLGFNLWWYWRDTRPLPDLHTISRWISREEYARAEAPLREHVRRSPHDGEARTMLARVLAAQGNLLGCARQLHQVPFWSPEKPEALYREGQAYLKIDRARDAESAWLELIRDDPIHAVDPGLFDDACLALLELYATEDRWDDAYSIIWTGYDHAPAADKRKWLGMRMRSELERISPKESIVKLRRYVAAAPDDGEALRALAGAELALGQHAEAERHLEACLRGRADDARAWRDRVAMLLEQGELARFLALLGQAPPSAENEPETWFFRGVASEKAADWHAAAQRFQKAIELDPFVSKYYYRLSMAEERLGRHEQGLAHRKRTREMNEARVGLRGAYADYFAAQEPQKSGAPDAATAARHLASICETLGWFRAAQAWNRLSISP